jgi:tetratricopeptide (TPR) repeat protein
MTVTAAPGGAERLARRAHRLAVQAGAAGQPAAGARRLRAGLLALGWDEHGPPLDARAAAVPQGHRALAARMLLSLAHFEAEQGRTGYGRQLLDQAERLADPADRGILRYQRGLLLIRTGHGGAALALFDEAVTLLQGYPDLAHLARALLNRGVLQLGAGHVGLARADFSACGDVAATAGLDLIGAKAVHNLGFCDLLAGDIPAALRQFGAAAGVYGQAAPGNLPVLAIDRARALLAAGLASDAARELDGALAAFRRQHLDQDRAEAELARAQAALVLGDLPAARRWATAAQQRSRRRGNDSGACLAELTRLRARALSPATGVRVAAEAQQLAGRLRARGLARDADTAELIGARALVTAGRLVQAGQWMGTVQGRGPRLPLEVSLLRWLARAELASRDGRPSAALAALRAGLGLVGSRRARMGSVDLQTGTAALGTDLAATGLRLALDRGSAPLVYAWLERSRAQAFRARPVRPPADPEAAAWLAELRQLSRLSRAAELAGRPDRPGHAARRADLQRRIRERSWAASGPAGRAATAQAGLAEVRAALAGRGQALAAVLARQGRLVAVLITPGGARLIPLGDAGVAAEAARRLAADLDTLAGRRLPGRLGDVIRNSVRRQAATLAAEVITPLLAVAGDAAGLILAPHGDLASVPWSLLPGLHGRPVTVTPSASAWLAAQRRQQPAAAPSPAAAPVLLAAGPDLPQAEREIAELAAAYPGGRVLAGPGATVAATLRALDGAPLAHLAAHGYHDSENFLFSRLHLADGPLMAYDVQQLAAAPRQVILSACDIGRAQVRPGGELLGFTAALLYAGTATVIASVARVQDDAPVRLMTAYHRRLAAGTAPAEALAAAAAAEPFSPFVCFGSG